MKGVAGGGESNWSPPEKTTLKKPSLIEVKIQLNWQFSIVSVFSVFLNWLYSSEHGDPGNAGSFLIFENFEFFCQALIDST